MKVLFLSFLMLIRMGAQASIAAAADGTGKKATVLGVISAVKKSEFDKIQGFFKSQWQSCSTCEVKNLTPYTESGELDRAALAAALEKAPGQVQILLLSWNEAVAPENKPVLEALKKLSGEKILILGPAGEPQGDAPTHPLSQTWLGQVPDALIIGEVNERERMAPKSFYGPEMLTALRTPKDSETGWVTPLFAARLTKEWGKRGSEDEWVRHFRDKKAHSRRIWPEIEDLFGR